jgi:hypothetical protein
MPFPNYGGGKKSNLNAFPAAKKRKDNPQATKNQKRMRSGNTVDKVNTGPSNKMMSKLFGNGV